ARQYRKKRKKELEEEHLPKGFKDYSIEEVLEYAREVGVNEFIINSIDMRYNKESMKRKYLTIEIKKALDIKINGTAIRNDYISGFIHGLNQKFKEQVEQNKEEWGLILVKDKDLVEHYNEISKNFTTARASTYTSGGDMGAYSAGVKQGKKFQTISGQIE